MNQDTIARLVDYSRGHQPFCDFCGKWTDVSELLVKAPNGACICPDCVDVAVAIIKDDRDKEAQAQQAAPNG